ncbi:MAG: nucleotide exchange factor GrpE [Pseudomonadota bacterium]
MAHSEKEQAGDGVANQQPAGVEDQDAASGADRAANTHATQDADTKDGEVLALEDVARLEEEVASLKDQLLRAVAETENVRSRARREREDGIKYAGVPLIKDLLSVADNLERAMSSVPLESLEGDEALKNLVTGVEMTARELQTVFERHKIEVIDPVGHSFDPHSHEALFEVPDPSQAPGKVVQVVQVGYRLHDRLLRPARVGISKAVDAGTAPSQTEDVPAPGSKIDTQA